MNMVQTYVSSCMHVYVRTMVSSFTPYMQYFIQEKGKYAVLVAHAYQYLTIDVKVPTSFCYFIFVSVNRQMVILV